jgi:hypothetical protein
MEFPLGGNNDHSKLRIDNSGEVSMSSRWKLPSLFLALFLFRTLFGLCHPFFSPDELQTYLIGLKWYGQGGWPYFGPDLIVTETGFYTQIPGPLEAWMVGWPLVVFPFPEAPFLFLNFLSTGAIAVLAWYLSRRLPEIPFPFLFIWIATLPWNLHESTNPINPSYLLLGSILFFLGFFEAVPSLTRDYLPPAAAFSFMGFGLFWDMQFHNSWVLLPPFVLLALGLRIRDGKFHFVHDFVSFLVGAAPLAALLLPTYLKYGLNRGAGGFHLFEPFNLQNFLAFFTILGRFFSIPCFETLRYIGSAWLVMPGLFMVLMGWAQPLALFILGWFKDEKHRDFRTLSKVVLFAFLTVWVSFWFTSKEPLAHIYYILMPLLAVYSLYIWSRWAPRRGWRLFALACIMANLWFQSGFMVRMWKTQSLYTDRGRVLKAIQAKDYRILGERRPGSFN